MTPFEQLVESLAVSGIDKLEHILRIAKERNVEVPGDKVASDPHDTANRLAQQIMMQKGADSRAVELRAGAFAQAANTQPAELTVTPSSDVEVK